MTFASPTGSLVRLAVGGAFAFVSTWATAETNRVVFPPDIDRLVHYTTVTRGNVTENMLTTPEAVEAIKAGKSVPTGTYFVLVDHRDGSLYRYFVMQNGENWGADYDARRRTADWQFQWFWPDRSVNLKENTARCQSCHQGVRDFLFTAERIRDRQ